MAGRKTKYNPAIVEEIIGSLMLGLTDNDAAVASGISWDTFDRWQKQHADFAERVTRAKAQRSRTWLMWMRDKAKAGDVKAIESLLDRCTTDYRKTTDMNLRHSGADGGPLTVSLVRIHEPEPS